MIWSNISATDEATIDVRSGRLMLRDGLMDTVGEHGYSWSRSDAIYTSNTSGNAYTIQIITGYSDPSAGPYARSYGFPVRCLVYKFLKGKVSWDVSTKKDNLAAALIQK